MATRRTGSIVKRGRGKYLIRWSTGKDAEGNYGQQSKTIHGTRADAEAALAERTDQVRAGVKPRAGAQLYGAFLDEWLESGCTHVRARTLRDYRDAVRRYVKPYLGQLRLDEITAFEVQKRLVNVLAGRKPALSSRTIRYAHTLVTASLRAAVEWRLIALHPCPPRSVKLPKSSAAEGRKNRTLTPADCAKFLGAIEGTRYATYFRVLLLTGLRPSEALGLQWDRVDLDAGTLRVEKSLSLIRADEYTLEEPKTLSSRRDVQLMPPIVAALKAHRARQAKDRLAWGAHYRGDLDFVFADERGEPLNQRNLIARHFKPALERAGLDTSTRVYDLRHTYCTLLIGENIPANVVSESVGHSSAKMTLDVYSHVQPQHRERALAIAERVLLGGGGGS